MTASSVHASVRADAARFAADTMAPAAEAWHDAGSVPRSFFQAAAAAGLTGLLVAPDRGGRGLGVAAYVDVLGSLARVCMAATFALVVHNNLAATVARDGSPVQRARYLDGMLAGDIVGAFLLTEPGAGSDAQAIATRARNCGSDWMLDGDKAWISNAVTADLLCVFAQTAPGTGARGIASFLVEAATPGVARLPAYALLGGQALGTGGFRFDGCRVPVDAVLHAPGSAFRAALAGIDVARLAVAGMCCGMLERALEVALDYTAGRAAFGQTIGDFQGVQWMLADCATELAAARALTAQAAAAAERGAADATLLAAQAKKFATGVAFTRIATCMQVMGAAGLARDYPLARHLAAAKVAQYLDGATEVQNVVIARALDGAHACGSARRVIRRARVHVSHAMSTRHHFLQRFGFYALAALTLGACSAPRLADAAHATPVFDPRVFFDGRVRAWGIVQDWRGRLARSFVVDIDGQREGEAIVLDERFVYDDGERDTRTWRIGPAAHGGYTGVADDIVGVADGAARGNALRWRYTMDLAVDGRRYRVKFDDWMWQLDEGTLVNRSYVRKFGVTVAEVTLFMRREE